jgi:hypothetical protein
MPRFTKLEREALQSVANDILAGDSLAFFNGGCEVDDPPRTPEEKRAVKLQAALVSALEKLDR